MKIIMVRHGETDGNLKRIMLGQRIDEPLNSAGLKQAAVAAEKLASIPIGKIFASPLMRTRQTAEIIAGTIGIPISFRDELKERDFGTLSGKKWDDLKSPKKGWAGKLIQQDRDQKYDYRPWGGESVEDVKARLKHIFSELKEMEDTALLVTHAGILRLTYHLLTAEKNVARFANASIHEFNL